MSARAHAHLTGLLHRGVTTTASDGRGGCGPVELALDEAVVSVGPFCRGRGFVDDAGPDGAERQEDAGYGEHLGAQFGDGVLELEGAEDGWWVLVRGRVEGGGMGVRGRGGGERVERTRNDECLTPHDEDNLHRSKLRHLEHAALHNRVAQLVSEDAAKQPDGHRLRDVRRQHDIRIESLQPQIRPGAENHKGKLVACCHTSHECGDAHDDEALLGSRGDAHDIHLETERHHNEDRDDEGERVHSDQGSFVARADALVVAEQLRVRVPPRAGDEAAEQDAADGVGEQAEAVDEEDGGLALLRAREEEEHEEQQEGGADLRAVADGEAAAVEAEAVEVVHFEGDGAAVWGDDVHALREWVHGG
jgi:hypothetical protein